MPFTKNNAMIQALSAYAADDSLTKRILPRRPRRNLHFLDAQVFHTAMEGFPVNAVPVVNQETRRLVIGKCLAELAGNPLRGWVLRDVEVDHTAALMTKNHQAVQDLKRRRRHGEKVQRRDLANVVVQEGTPILRWRLRRALQVLRHRRFRHVMAEQVQFGLNARCAPQWILAAHAANKPANLGINRWPAGLSARCTAMIQLNTDESPRPPQSAWLCG